MLNKFCFRSTCHGNIFNSLQVLIPSPVCICSPSLDPIYLWQSCPFKYFILLSKTSQDVFMSFSKISSPCSKICLIVHPCTSFTPHYFSCTCLTRTAHKSSPWRNPPQALVLHHGFWNYFTWNSFQLFFTSSNLQSDPIALAQVRRL